MTRCKRGKIKTTSPISSKQCSLACWNLCLDLPLRWKLLPSSPLWLDRKYNKTCTCTNRFCSWEAFYVFTPWTYDKYDRVGAPPQAQAKAWAWGGAVINTLPPTAPRPHPPSHAKRGSPYWGRTKLLPSSPLWLDCKYNKTCTCTNRFCSLEAFNVFTTWT